jgi:F420-dependent oxidoreductase-like protein
MMRIGWNGGGNHRSLETIRADARRAVADGYSSFWLSQIAGPDSLTALAAIAADAPGIELGTSIVPIYGRHPLPLAQQALAVQAATGGRLVLGIGPSHKLMVEGMLGESYARPFTRTKEVLAALSALVRGEPVSIAGAEITVRGQVAIEAPAPSILIAALGPKMLELAGREADGTTLWMVGPKTISAHIAPRIREAASAAGRSEPRILAGVPVCLTEDVGRARANAAEALKMYAGLPAYRAMLDREGIAGPEDLLVAGSEGAVREGLARFGAAGATDVRVGALAPTENEAERTRELLAAIAKERAA